MSIERFLYNLYAPVVREAFEEALSSIYRPPPDNVYFTIKPVFVSFPKTRNRSLVRYDKSIAKQRIKQNKERYKTVVMNRRLETKRVRTHMVK